MLSIWDHASAPSPTATLPISNTASTSPTTSEATNSPTNGLCSAGTSSRVLQLGGFRMSNPCPTFAPCNCWNRNLREVRPRVHNNLFGGTMLSWIDESAVAYVNEVCHCPTMVTLKIEEVLFKSPVKENNLIKIYGQIDRIGGKSITVSVEARKFNVYSHEEAVVCSTRLFLFVSTTTGRASPSPITCGKSIPTSACDSVRRRRN